MPAQQDRLPTSIDHAFRTVIAEATKAAVGRSLTGVQGKLESAMEQVAQAETGLKGATAGARDAVKRGRSAIRKLRQLVGAVAFMWVLSKVVGLILTLHDVSRRVDAQTIVSVVSVLVPLAWYWLKTTDVRRVPRRRQWLRDQVCRRHRRRRSRWSGSWSPKLRVFFREHTSIRLVTKTSLISIVVTATSLISILIVYNVIPAHPPSPAAVLNCTTDGLPDLEVVCSTQFSRNSPRGYINFGDECQQQEVDLGDRLSSQANSRQATPVKGIYHKRYKRGGDYRVELKLEGEIANSTAGRTVTVKESATLPKGELDLTGLYWITDGSGATRSLRYRIRQDKFEYNSSNKHTWTIKADHGRKFTNCEFEATTASMNVRYDRDGLELTGDGGAKVSFSVTDNWLLLIGRRAWFDGIAKCIQTPADAGEVGEREEGENQLSLGKFVISRYGVIELDLVRAEMPFESKRIKKWGFKHKGRDYTGEKVNGVAVESIALDCHGVSLTLVDPPMLEWKDRLSKVWIKVAPLG